MLEEIRELLEVLVVKLEKAANQEKQLGADICHRLDCLNWTTKRICNSLEEIKDRYGV